MRNIMDEIDPYIWIEMADAVNGQHPKQQRITTVYGRDRHYGGLCQTAVDLFKMGRITEDQTDLICAILDDERFNPDPEAPYGYIWPLTAEGDKQRREYCMDVAARYFLPNRGHDVSP